MAGDGGGRPSELGDSILRPANSALRGDSIGGGRSNLGLRRHRRAAASFSACFCARADARRFAGGGCAEVNCSVSGDPALTESHPCPAQEQKV